jgi:hypothetical protein
MLTVCAVIPEAALPGSCFDAVIIASKGSDTGVCLLVDAFTSWSVSCSPSTDTNFTAPVTESPIGRLGCPCDESPWTDEVGIWFAADGDVLLTVCAVTSATLLSGSWFVTAKPASLGLDAVALPATTLASSGVTPSDVTGDDWSTGELSTD